MAASARWNVAGDNDAWYGIANVQRGASISTSNCPIARIASYHRWGIELLAPPPAADAAAALQELLTHLRNLHLLRSDARTAVDVDPVDLL